MRYLLDTDICVAILRGQPKAVAWAQARSPDDLAISSITRYELRVGVLRCAPRRQKGEVKKVEAFQSKLHELPFTTETANRAAEVRHHLEAEGQGIGPMDTWIAATALESNRVLITGNKREFDRVDGLQVEGWM